MRAEKNEMEQNHRDSMSIKIGREDRKWGKQEEKGE